MTHCTRRLATPPLRPRLLAVVAGFALVAGAALAEANPYYFKASETLTYDSNVFRLSDDELRDGISSTALSAGINQPIGRQNLYANATVRHDQYKNWDFLDNTGYDIGAGLKWEAASRWGGDVLFNFSRALAKYDEYGASLTEAERKQKNEEKVSYAALRAQYGLISTWSLEGRYNHLDVSYTNGLFANRERDSDTYGLGVYFRPSGLWTFGLAARKTRGEYPNYAAGVRDEFDRTDIDLTAKLVASGLSTLSARLSHTEEDHDIDTTREYSGLTGEVRWDYQPTGKLGFGTVLTRETGSGASSAGSSGGPTAYLSDSSLTTRLGLTATWAATGKIRVKADATFQRSTYDNQFSGIGGTSSTNRNANSHGFGIAAYYDLMRSVSFECGARYQKREQLVTVTDALPGYQAQTVYCNGTFTLN